MRFEVQWRDGAGEWRVHSRHRKLARAVESLKKLRSFYPAPKYRHARLVTNESESGPAPDDFWEAHNQDTERS